LEHHEMEDLEIVDCPEKVEDRPRTDSFGW
jgi:hypothetical protein